MTYLLVKLAFGGPGGEFITAPMQLLNISLQLSSLAHLWFRGGRFPAENPASLAMFDQHDAGTQLETMSALPAVFGESTLTARTLVAEANIQPHAWRFLNDWELRPQYWNMALSSDQYVLICFDEL